MVTYEKYAEIRDKKHLKDSDVAKRAGIPQSTFSDWKKGKSAPKLQKMQKIAQALGIPYNEFIGPVGMFSAYNPKNPLIEVVKYEEDVEDGNAPDLIMVKNGSDLSEDEAFVLETMRSDDNFRERLMLYAKLMKAEKKGSDPS